MSWMLQGAHRGGGTIVRELVRAGARPEGRVIVADPHEARAPMLAGAMRRELGVAAEARQSTGLPVLAELDAADPVVLASDTVAGLRDTFSARGATRPALVQLAGRGAGGAGGLLFAVQSTVLAGDEEAASATALLFRALEQLAPPASSRAITRSDALAASTLAPLRHIVSARSASRLFELDRDPEDLVGGTLAMTDGDGLVPLLVGRGDPSVPARVAREHACDLAASAWHRRGLRGEREMVVALVVVANVQLVRVAARPAGTLRVVGVDALGLSDDERAASAGLAPALVTD